MSMSKPWQQSYPPSLRDYRIDPQALRGSVADFARHGAEHFADAPAFTIVLPTGLHADITFSEVDALSDAFAAYLLKEQGLKSGDVVAIQLPNSLHYPIAVLGTWKAGLIVTNVNPLYTARELEAQLTDSGAKLLVACDLFVGRAEAVIAEKGVRLVTTSLGDFFPPAVGAAIQQKLAAESGGDLTPRIAHQRFSEALTIGQGQLPVQAEPHPVALYQYTGGTTGRSKGAVLSHANLLAVLRMAEDYISAHDVYIEPGEAIGVIAAQSIVSRTLDPVDMMVVSITSMTTGEDTFNVIPQTCALRGTVRCFRNEDRAMGRDRMKALSEQIAAAAGGRAEFTWHDSYPPMVNHPEETEIAAQVADEIMGADCPRAVPPQLGAEDFAYMLEARPGAMIMVGNGPTPECHHPAYDFAEETMPAGASFWVRLTERALPLGGGS